MSANDMKKKIQKFEETCSFEVKSIREEIICFDANRRFDHRIRKRNEQWGLNMKE